LETKLRVSQNKNLMLFNQNIEPLNDSDLLKYKDKGSQIYSNLALLALQYSLNNDCIL